MTTTAGTKPHEAKTGFSRFEVKEINEQEGTFTGLASTYDLDLGGDVIRPGAFKRTLKNWKDSKRNVPLVDSHDVWSTVTKIVGQMDEGEETDEGLLGVFSMIPDDPTSTAVFKRVKGGYVDGLSIGHRPVKIEYPKTDEERKAGIYRYLDEVKLSEISVVMFPMNPNARIDTSTAKALLAKAQDRDLSGDELDELKSLHAELGAIIAGKKDPEAEALADPEQAAKLADRIDQLLKTQLATRIEAVRHSSAPLLEL